LHDVNVTFDNSIDNKVHRLKRERERERERARDTWKEERDEYKTEPPLNIFREREREVGFWLCRLIGMEFGGDFCCSYWESFGGELYTGFWEVDMGKERMN
jgi:hypothetical protein